MGHGKERENDDKEGRVGEKGRECIGTGGGEMVREYGGNTAKRGKRERRNMDKKRHK